MRDKSAIAQGGVKNLLVCSPRHLKSVRLVSIVLLFAVVRKEYPRPTPRQLNQLGEMGELVHTTLNEPGYSDVLAINTGKQVVPWWVVLGVELP